MSNRTSIKYPGTRTRTSEINICNMYIRYTFFLLLDKAALQIRQILGAITLPVSLLLAVIALSIRLRAVLRFHRRRGSFLATLLEFPLRLALLLETGGLVDHQHLVLFLDLNLSSF